MVGKSRGTLRGTIRTTTGGAVGGGTTGSGEDVSPSGLDTGRDIIEYSLQVKSPAEPAHHGGKLEAKEMLSGLELAEELQGATPDLTGRGTPPKRIAPDVVEGTTAEERLERGPTTEEDTGIGAGSSSNLGTRHGRTPQGGDIAGAGASLSASQKRRKSQYDK